MNWCWKSNTRDSKLALEKFVSSFAKVINNILLVFITTYTFGLIWYRLSDHLLPTYIMAEPVERTWAYKFKLKNPPESFYADKGLMEPETEVYEKLVMCMYFMLTTLSTVGYGDYYPWSVAEKITSVLVMVVCGMIFAVLLGSLIEAFSPNIADPTGKNMELEKWFSVIKRIRLQPDCVGKDISNELKESIETHFNYYWEHDRVSIILDKREYFDTIPYKIQEHIIVHFAFEDVLTRVCFNHFFRTGIEFDDRFLFDVSFGFIPR